MPTLYPADTAPGSPNPTLTQPPCPSSEEARSKARRLEVGRLVMARAIRRPADEREPYEQDFVEKIIRDGIIRRAERRLERMEAHEARLGRELAHVTQQFQASRRPSGQTQGRGSRSATNSRTRGSKRSTSRTSSGDSSAGDLPGERDNDPPRSAGRISPVRFGGASCLATPDTTREGRGHPSKISVPADPPRRPRREPRRSERVVAIQDAGRSATTEAIQEVAVQRQALFYDEPERDRLTARLDSLYSELRQERTGSRSGVTLSDAERLRLKREVPRPAHKRKEGSGTCLECNAPVVKPKSGPTPVRCAEHTKAFKAKRDSQRQRRKPRRSFSKKYPATKAIGKRRKLREAESLPLVGVTKYQDTYCTEPIGDGRYSGPPVIPDWGSSKAEAAMPANTCRACFNLYLRFGYGDRCTEHRRDEDTGCTVISLPASVPEKAVAA